MILALALCLLAVPQEATPAKTQQGVAPETQQTPKAQQPTAEEIQAWWDGLTETEQNQYRERLKRYQQLQPTLQEELGRRHGLLRAERQRIMQNLTEAERKQFDVLPHSERRRFLDDRARANMRQRGQALEQTIPDFGPPPPQESWTQRRERVARVFEQQREPQVRQAIAQAVADGWIGVSAAKWLDSAPIYEAMSALGEVRKWQFLQQAAEKGLWEQMGFDEQRRREISQMPAMEFFQAMRGHREGRQRGPGEFGGFGERRGGERRGPDGKRGPGQGRHGGRGGPGGPPDGMRPMRPPLGGGVMPSPPQHTGSGGKEQ
jgi:hypothetical protein